MTQLSIRHISTNKYGHRLSAYETPKMTGYIVSVTADGITSQYDFLDSMELALEYRDALDAACESWNQEATRAENLYEATGNENGFASAGKMWAGYMLLAYNAIYPRWELEPIAESAAALDFVNNNDVIVKLPGRWPYAETMAENCRRQALEGVDYGDAYDGRELVDQEPTYEGWD